MRSFHSPLFALLVAGAAAACSSPSDPGKEPAGESQARLVLSVSGQSGATLRVTATDEVSARTAIDQAVDLTAGQAVVLSLFVPASSYAFHVTVFEDAAQKHLLGSADAHATLEADATTEVNLDAQVEGAVAGVSVNVNAAPTIDGVDVDVSGGVPGSLAVHVDATDAEGGALTFFWWGDGILGVVQGGQTIELPAAAVVAAGMINVHVIVQDEGGAITGADIAIDAIAHTAHAAPRGPTPACHSAHAQCVLACGVGVAIDPAFAAAHGACMAGCGLTLASCL